MATQFSGEEPAKDQSDRESSISQSVEPEKTKLRQCPLSWSVCWQISLNSSSPTSTCLPKRVFELLRTEVERTQILDIRLKNVVRKSAAPSVPLWTHEKKGAASGGYWNFVRFKWSDSQKTGFSLLTRPKKNEFLRTCAVPRLHSGKRRTTALITNVTLQVTQLTAQRVRMHISTADTHNDHGYGIVWLLIYEILHPLHTFSNDP